jgi:hypothetical protein
MLSSILKTISCKVMAFEGSKPMHVVGKLGVEIGNNQGERILFLKGRLDKGFLDHD